MRPWLLSLLPLLPASFADPIATNTQHNVTYHGLTHDGSEYFLSLRYGLDTGGQNRFKSPRPFSPPPGSSIDATLTQPACPQPLGQSLLPFYLQNVTEISEDCLWLNVARPCGTKAGDNLPVMVFIHGGSFYLGSKDEPVANAGALIQQSVENGHPVIQVNINYRLGVFGFAKSDALYAEHSLNAGLKDQRLAVEWVQQNIAHFGGDCHRITIFGQSSGGLAVGLQQLAYGGSRPLPFQQAICESQVLEPGITGNFTAHAMAKVAANVSCDRTSLQSAATVECLRALTLDQLNAGQINTHGQSASENVGDEWLPTVDGDFLPAAPSELIASGHFHRVPLVVSWCESDANPFVDQNITTANDTYTWFREYLPGFAAKTLQSLLALYPVSEFTPNVAANQTKPAEFYRAGRILRDILFVCQPIYLGKVIAGAPHEKHDWKQPRSALPDPNSSSHYARPRVWLATQNQTILDPILDFLGETGEGVVHTSEFAYVFANFTPYHTNDFPVVTTSSDDALQKRESRSWSSFAALGQPSVAGKKNLQGWEPAFAGPGVDNEHGLQVYLIGGGQEGLSSTAKGGKNKALVAQKIDERCAFLNSDEVIKQLQY